MLYGDELQTCIPSDCSTGQDTIAAQDGFDDTVYCGPGEDFATLDAADLIPSYGQDVCERVSRGVAASGGTGAAPGAGGGPAAADVTAPQLRDLRIGNLRRGRSTKLRFKLSEAATVSLTLQRRVKRRGTVRWVNMRGTLRHQGKAGSNERRFDGRLQGRRLKRGRYRLVAVARDAAGNRSQAKRVAFGVLR
ncbi:MAG: hypothetical protein M3N04_05285 [Actinomycetota bacterium]|nr:hypothetical protein [Actinomycetota bacterium]